MWLNRGELRRFKGERGPAARATAVPNVALEGLVHRYADSANWPTVKQLASATESTPSAESDDLPDLKREFMWSALWLGARALLRLLFAI